ncbi:MAG: hypothetical protein QOE58_1886 [Actinomycetota bacterium]|jgi:hypothetical protein|nr:hypothetical protein [Actinomycetota bacterium]
MRAAAVVALTLALAASACVSPSRTDRDYELKAGNTAKAVASSLATAFIAAKAADDGKGTGPYFSVLLGDAEKDAASVENTFDSVQPPSREADRLRDAVDALLSDASSGLAKMRITVRRGQLHELLPLAVALQPTLDKLRQLADRYQ